MAQTSASAQQDAPHVGRTPRGRFAPGTSGNPAGAAIKNKRVAELFGAMQAELGMSSAADSALLLQAAQLLTRSTRVKDPAVAAKLANTASRIVTRVRANAARSKVEPATFAPYRSQLGLDRLAEAEPVGAET